MSSASHSLEDASRGGLRFAPRVFLRLLSRARLRLFLFFLTQEALVVLAQDRLHLARLGVDRLHLLLERLRRVFAVHAQQRQRAEVERPVVRRELELDVFAPRAAAGRAARSNLERLRLASRVGVCLQDQPVPVLLVRRPRRAPHLERSRRGRVELVVGHRHRGHRDLLRELHRDPLALLPARRARAQVVRVLVFLERRAGGGLGLGVRGNNLRPVGSRRVVHLGGVRVANLRRDGARDETQRGVGAIRLRRVRLRLRLRRRRRASRGRVVVALAAIGALNLFFFGLGRTERVTPIRALSGDARRSRRARRVGPLRGFFRKTLGTLRTGDQKLRRRRRRSVVVAALPFPRVPPGRRALF